MPPATSAPSAVRKTAKSGPSGEEIVMQMTMGHVQAAALHVATKLGIPDLLADGSRPVAELAKKTGMNEDALYRVLRALASNGVFTESAPRTFALTDAAQALRKRPGSLRDFALFLTNPLHYKIWPELMHSVKTGETLAERVLGKPIFEYFASEPEEGALFHSAMTNFSEVVIAAALKAYDFSGIGTLVDVAGGHGMVLCAILQKYPAMKGILADLPEVVPGAQQRIRSLSLENRCRTEVIDFFKAVPAGDAYIMKHIIHDWNDEQAATILHNCHKAFTDKKKGKVLLLESVINADNAPHFAKWLDLEMLVFPGGRERTEREFAELFEKSGFKLTRVVPTESPLCLIEAVAR
jgi:hypothetical protein